MGISCSGIAAAVLLCVSGACLAQPDAMTPAAIDAGRKLFLSVTPACAICHTLQDAGAAGAVGPVLDELKPDASRVEKAIRNGIGQMPPYTALSDEQVRTLAAYVAHATGAAAP